MLSSYRGGKNHTVYHMTLDSHPLTSDWRYQSLCVMSRQCVSASSKYPEVWRKRLFTLANVYLMHTEQSKIIK